MRFRDPYFFTISSSGNSLWVYLVSPGSGASRGVVALLPEPQGEPGPRASDSVFASAPAPRPGPGPGPGPPAQGPGASRARACARVSARAPARGPCALLRHRPLRKGHRRLRRDSPWTLVAPAVGPPSPLSARRPGRSTHPFARPPGRLRASEPVRARHVGARPTPLWGPSLQPSGKRPAPTEPGPPPRDVDP